MLLGRRASRTGLKWDFQQTSGFLHWSWLNFRKTNAQRGTTAFQTQSLASLRFPNSSISIFPPLYGAGPSIPSLLFLTQTAPFSPRIPSRPPWNQSPGKMGRAPRVSWAWSLPFEKIPPEEKLTSYSHRLFLDFFFFPPLKFPESQTHAGFDAFGKKREEPKSLLENP